MTTGARNFIHTLQSWFSNLSGYTPHRLELPPLGLHYFSRSDGFWRSRIHLRIEPDYENKGIKGTLFINANRILHLNSTATIMAFMLLKEYPERQAISTLCLLFRIPNNQAESEYKKFQADFLQLFSPDEFCPICDLNIEVTPPFSTIPVAPYRMDLALTYQCNNDCSHCYNERSRNYSQIYTKDWKRILDSLWDQGIPHIVFTGGEPTLREDLPELILYAEQKGQITGLNTNARRLSDKNYLHKLVEAGLDHIQITVESHNANIHDEIVHSKGAWKQTIAGLQNALDTPLFVMTNTTLLRQNSIHLQATLEFITNLGVPTIGLNALIYSGKGRYCGNGLNERELSPLLELARDHTSESGQRLIWYSPTQYCQLDPTQLDLGVKGCTAALYNMCIEPDGGVIPCQSYYQQLGNLLTDRWESIWNHPLSVSLRERRYIVEKCQGCSLLSECGGGCPLALENIPISPSEAK